MPVLFCFSDSPASAGFFYGLIVMPVTARSLFFINFVDLSKQNWTDTNRP